MNQLEQLAGKMVQVNLKLFVNACQQSTYASYKHVGGMQMIDSISEMHTSLWM